MIGPYRILERIGQGGMGTVYAAEQRTPVRRRVAVKVVQPGMATRDVLARFGMERRALAAMNHRCIAKIFDAGETERGMPYFVMELVEGLPLTDYCDKHRLSVEQRLELFLQVCAGVQHAHQKGVIHRDLKPGNVLVAREGDEPVPKILDFGLMKATNRDFLDATLYTERDQILGTPEYMSPEQIGADGEVLDVRADVYSLGVMLYELLSGQRPFSTEELRNAGVLEAMRLIREQEPLKPSAKLAQQNQTASQSAELRRSSVVALSRTLRGDLDWVVMRAMAKEPERRYESANALAMDLRRHLAHEPVLAGPPSASYRARKLLRRYRVQAIAALLVMLSITAGGIASYLGFREADRRTREFDLLAGVVIHDRAVSDVRALYGRWPPDIPALQRWLEGDPVRLRQLLPDVQATLTQLEARVSSPSGVAGAAEFAREEDGYLHRALSALVENAGSLERNDVAHVRDVRLRWARHLESLAGDPELRRAWADCRQDLAKSERYTGQPLGNLPPQLGLVPIGPNPVTGYWEFYHLRSAWDGHSDPRSLTVPHHNPDGAITVRDDTGIVFVLIPGATAWIGAQRDDPADPRFEPDANPDERPHQVALAPFFLARHELTKGQWARLAEPGFEREPSTFKVGTSLRGAPVPIGWTHPVCAVSWSMAHEVLGRFGLNMPTEAQWEYACRAGTTTPWYTGATVASLQGHANLADRTAGEYYDWNHDDEVEDGWAMGAWPVGSGKANPFGLFDMHGNVVERCLDPYVPYASARSGDGFHGPPGVPEQSVTRGGSYNHTSHLCRSAYRGAPPPDRRWNQLGVRAARAILN